MRISRILLLQIGILLFISGCIPGVAWRPDSSGFIYTDKKGSRLLDFDLKSKTSRVLVADTGTKTLWPALSPDGERLAVARNEVRKGLPPRLQVILYSSAGKEEARSRWFNVPEKPGKSDAVVAAFLFWGPNDRVLVLGEGTFIYDVTKDQLSEVPKTVLWFAGMPGLHPGGKGFLAYDESGEDVKLLFVDWEGKKQALEGGLSKKGEPCLIDWDKDTAILQDGARIFEADTVKLTLTESRRKPLPLLEAPGDRTGFWAFPGGQTAVCIYRVMEKTADKEREVRRIEVQDLAGKKRHVVPMSGEASPVFMPSPNRKYVALFHAGPAKDVEKILVLDAAGKAVVDVQLEP